MTQDPMQITSHIKSFPGMPGAAVLIEDPEIDVSQIESILQRDAGLTANLLKLANSAYFGIPSKIGSVRQAVLLLGLKRLIQMVIASCVSAIMDKPIPGYELPPGELWRHSIAVSVAAESLVNELNVVVAEELFTAALLHDVGKLILGQPMADALHQINDEISRGIALEAAEEKVLGINHADVGARILSQWSLPGNIVNAVRWHHDPEAAEKTDPMLDIVHVANVLCMMIGIGVGREGLQYEPSEVVVKRLGLESHHLEKVAGQTIQGVEELSEVLSSQ